MVAAEAILSCPNAIKPLVSATYPAGGAAAALGVSAPPSGNAALSSGCPLAPPLGQRSKVKVICHQKCLPGRLSFTLVSYACFARRPSKTEMDLPSPQLRSCSHLSLGWQDHISCFLLP